jgi:alpha-D-xyloside xylohydrolase
MSVFKRSAGLFLVLPFVVMSFLQAAPLPVTGVQQNADGVTLAMQTGAMWLQVCGERTIHVVYSPSGVLPDGSKSFAVQRQPAPGAFVESENDKIIALKIGRGSIQVVKRTGALVFLDAEGEPCLQEETDGGKSLTPATAGGIKTNTVDQKFVRDISEGLFGLGQHPSGAMNYVDATVHLQQENGDVAVPMLVSSKGYGIFWNNPSVTDVKFGGATDPTVEWRSEFGDAIDYYMFFGPKLDDVIGAYRDLTGAVPMMGRWAWGFWQCKQRYHSQQQLLDTVARYREMQVPIDGIIQDWLYWYPNAWGSHQFNATRYPDPAEMMRQLHDENVHLLISVWAKFDVNSSNANALRDAGGLYPKVISYVYPPGKGQWYDPFKTSARELYWQQISRDLFADGVDGWWLDASEPELSGKWGEYRNFRTAGGPGTEVFNAFPLMHTTAVFEGQRKESSDKRVFILTRSAYAGQQRNATVTWSGDIQGRWDVFAKQISSGINFTISGIPYWNTDTGGFFGGSPTDPKYAELFTRWFQFSAFCPMFRIHGSATEDAVEPTNKDKPGKEIWQFPPDTQKILTDYDKLRYHFLPYIYSVAWKVTHENYTMMRGLVMDFRNDPQVYNIPDQYLFGPALMVTPVTHAGAQTRKVYLPAGTTWTNFWTGQSISGGQSTGVAAPIEILPLYVRAGSIIPYGPEVQSAMEKDDPMELRVYRGADGAFTLYEDEGDNYNYEKGFYATIPFKWDEKAKRLTIGAREGQFPGMLEKRTFRVVWVAPGHGVGLDSTPMVDVEAAYDGHEIVECPLAN